MLPSRANNPSWQVPHGGCALRCQGDLYGVLIAELPEVEKGSKRRRLNMKEEKTHVDPGCSSRNPTALAIDEPSHSHVWMIFAKKSG